MNELKLYLTSGIFVAVTICKLLFPSGTEELRRQVVALIDMDIDYRTMVAEVGSLLTDDSIQQAMARFGVTEKPHSAEVPLPTVQCITPSPTETDPDTAVSTSVLAAVEAFHTSQEAYAAYATPANVSYEALRIPFDYNAPVDGALSSGFGYRIHPIDQEVLFHYGTDYEVEEGTPITAFSDGTVSVVGAEAGYGNYVQITHADGWKTLYAHCASISVTSGQQVELGEVIALSGQTGRVTGPHLHLELTHNDLYTNPEFFLS